MRTFETTTELLPHQMAAVEKLLPSRVGAAFMEMGTGKSRTAIELAHIRQRKIDRVIWFCPVSLKETVEREIQKHTDCRDIYLFDDRTNSVNVPKDHRWHVVGIESMSSSNRVVAAVNDLITDKSMVICDESSYIKGHSAIRTERITYISSRARYRLALTGTPLSQGVVDLFAQMRFLSSRILGYDSFYSFAANHLEYSEKFPGMIVRAHNLEYLATKIQPYVYQVTKEECLDLPKKLHDYRAFYMTDEQAYWYSYVKDDILESIEDYSDSYWVSKAIFRLFTSLQEITSGFLNWKGKQYVMASKRPAVLVDVIYSLPDNEKVVIFCKFQYDVDQIRKALAKEFGEDSVAGFDGRDSERKRYAAIDQFRREARFLVMTQSTGGHGFNLQDVCSYVIFYNNGFKYSERLQAEDRVHRIGQTRRPTYIDLYCVSGIEEKIDEAIAKKGDAVRRFRAEVNKVKDQKAKIKDLIKAL